MAKQAILNPRQLYVIAAERFPAAIRNTTIRELQRSAYDQIIAGGKNPMRWAKDNGVSKQFAYMLLLSYMQAELQAEAERRAERRAARFAEVYA